MKNFEEKLDQYAELVVKVGLNIQKGQRLLINSPIEAADLTRKITKYAYEIGCKRVFVDWGDTDLNRLHYLHASDDVLKDFIPQWEIDKNNSLAENNDCMLFIAGTDPNAYANIPPERIMYVQKNVGSKLQSIGQKRINGDVPWAIIGYPTDAWAQSIYPELQKEEAVSSLWEAIFKTVRVDQPDPIAAWQEHSATLTKKVDYLNEQKFKRLHYKSNGTDLTIELHPDHKWAGGGHHSTFGTTYIPNLPTEEVFTTPHKFGVSGTVSSTKPLSALGNLIENFSLTFKEGKVIDFTAEKGYESLKQLLSLDEGMLYLGEVALVPHDSPISNSGIIFNNTLFDENASCHLALGNAITMALNDGNVSTKEEYENRYINYSSGHTDFMIGSADLEITAEYQDGRKVPLFKNGNWATL
jgi:aminopeptidase